MLQGPLRTLFDQRAILTDVSGAGNNWAHGYHVYGPQYQDHIFEMIRCEAEQCDSLQGFFLIHSLGGGTGSGLGSYLLTILEVYCPQEHVNLFSDLILPFLIVSAA
jgi:tubulin epsilon